MKHRLKPVSSFGAGIHETNRDTSDEKKKPLTGQMDVPLDTTSESQICTGSKSTEERKETDDCILHPVMQNKTVPQTHLISDTLAHQEVPALVGQALPSHLDKDDHVQHDHLYHKSLQHKSLQQKEKEKTTSFLSDTHKPWKDPTWMDNPDQYHVHSLHRNETASRTARPIFCSSKGLDHDGKQYAQNMRWVPKNIHGAQQSGSHVKSKEIETKKKSSLFSNTYVPQEFHTLAGTPLHSDLGKHFHIKQHEQEATEKTGDLLSKSVEPLDVPTWAYSTSWNEMQRAKTRAKSMFHQDDHIKQHEQKETEKTSSLPSGTHVPFEYSIQTANTNPYNLHNFSRNETARMKARTEPIFDQDDHIKHEQKETWMDNPDQYNVHSLHRNETASRKARPIKQYSQNMRWLPKKKNGAQQSGSHVKSKEIETKKKSSLFSNTYVPQEFNMVGTPLHSDSGKYYHVKQHEQGVTEKTTSLRPSTSAHWNFSLLKEKGLGSPLTTQQHVLQHAASLLQLLKHSDSDEQEEPETTRDLLPKTAECLDVPNWTYNTNPYYLHSTSQNEMQRTKTRAKSTFHQDDHIKQHKQKETEKTSSLLDSIRTIACACGIPPDSTNPYKLPKSSRTETAKMKTRAEPMFDPNDQDSYVKQHEPKETESTTFSFSASAPQGPTWMHRFRSPSRNLTVGTKARADPLLGSSLKQYKQKRRERKMRAELLGSHVKHKQKKTEKKATLLSNTCGSNEVSTWKDNTNPCNLYSPPRYITRTTKDDLIKQHEQNETEKTESFGFLVHSWVHNNDPYNLHNPYILSPSDLRGLPQNNLPTKISCSLPCSHNMVLLRTIPKNNLTQASSSPDMLLKEFTPVITDDFDDETYSFHCSHPGVYQCSVTGLVFNMKGEGDVVYGTVPWNRRLLAKHHKKPAGPLFDIKCQQQSVCQLHLPHCEILSTGGGQFLQVAHVKDEGIDFIPPHEITDSHVVINITDFSGFGNVKDEDSPPDPVQALVLLFYRPPDDSDFRSILSVLLLPRNIVIRDLQRTRRKLIGDERYIDVPSECKLHPKHAYTLSTDPKDDLIKVQPKETEFDEGHHDSYFPSFQVILKKIIGDINLRLRHKSTSSCVWESEAHLFHSSVTTMNPAPKEKLLNVRSCFIEGISGPVLNSLLDRLLEKKVITDAEKEAADVIQNRRDKASLIIDTVRKKGDAASSEMINFLRENDPFLSQHLRLH